MCYPAYRNRIDPDFTENTLETADEVNFLRKPPINLEKSTMLQLPRGTRSLIGRQIINIE